MDLTIREVALILSRSERTVRAQLQRGELKGRKSGRVWLVRTDDLPLTAERRREFQLRAELAHDAVDATLPAKVRRARKQRSIRELQPFARGLEMWAAMKAEHPPATEPCSSHAALEAGLVELVYALQEYDSELRLCALRRVRRRWSRALAVLFLAMPPKDSPAAEWIDIFELELLPRLGGLLRWTDERRHGRGPAR